ncbi:hypothetical protein MJM59_33485, partial [Salmonella enterica subsp. enterica serovar Montevideo]|nr:hypothetical protein [Salmonella enterica subsp. enterica serovar Montevideo]
METTQTSTIASIDSRSAWRKKGHMFGEKESQRKMVSIRLPFISIYWLNREATNYWYTCARA